METDDGMDSITESRIVKVVTNKFLAQRIVDRKNKKLENLPIGPLAEHYYFSQSQ